MRSDPALILARFAACARLLIRSDWRRVGRAFLRHACILTLTCLGLATTAFGETNGVTSRPDGLSGDLLVEIDGAALRLQLNADVDENHRFVLSESGTTTVFSWPDSAVYRIDEFEVFQTTYCDTEVWDVIVPVTPPKSADVAGRDVFRMILDPRSQMQWLDMTRSASALSFAERLASGQAQLDCEQL